MLDNQYSWDESWSLEGLSDILVTKNVDPTIVQNDFVRSLLDKVNEQGIWSISAYHIYLKTVIVSQGK